MEVRANLPLVEDSRAPSPGKRHRGCEANEVALGGVGFDGGVEVGPSTMVDNPCKGRLWLFGAPGGEGGKGGQGLREVVEVLWELLAGIAQFFEHICRCACVSS